MSTGWRDCSTSWTRRKKSRDVGFVAVADFNRDGIADLALAGPGLVGILLGNDDGTF